MFYYLDMKTFIYKHGSLYVVLHSIYNDKYLLIRMLHTVQVYVHCTTTPDLVVHQLLFFKKP